jgi:hypothetical protein
MTRFMTGRLCAAIAKSTVDIAEEAALPHIHPFRPGGPMNLLYYSQLVNFDFVS